MTKTNIVRVAGGELGRGLALFLGGDEDERVRTGLRPGTTRCCEG